MTFPAKLFRFLSFPFSRKADGQSTEERRGKRGVLPQDVPLFSEVGGRDTINLPKRVGHVRLRAEAAHQRNFRKRQIGRGTQFIRFEQSLPDLILM